MKIALISYEYPPDTCYGGIATYAQQIAQLMAKRGHHVEVFAASHDRTATTLESGVLVHRLQWEKSSPRLKFAAHVVPTFLERHREIGFDVVEGAEAGAHARAVVAAVPEIPLVVKLHTPLYMTATLGYVQPTVWGLMRWKLGAIRQGRMPQPYPRCHYDYENDVERLHTLEADEVTTPSQALGELVGAYWKLSSDRIICVPNPYIPTANLLNIPIATQTNRVSFLGRLEVRKGILDLVDAIPTILKQCPTTRFRFIGQTIGPSPISGVNMRQYIEKKLRSHLANLEFTGAVPLTEIPGLLAETDVCVFPSRWENFPNVCLEAMAAARGIVGSSAGGMAEMLADGETGRLVDPRNPAQVATATIELLQNPEFRMQLGARARDRVVAEYNVDRIGVQQEASYQRAIQRRQALGSRQTPAVALEV
jgi:glycogen synthase